MLVNTHTHMHKRAWGLIRFIWGSCHITFYEMKEEKVLCSTAVWYHFGGTVWWKITPKMRAQSESLARAGDFYLNFSFFFFCLRPGATSCLRFKSENLPFKNKRIRRLLMFLSATRNGGNECETTTEFIREALAFPSWNAAIPTAVKVLLYEPYVSVKKDFSGQSSFCQCCSQYI